MDGQGGPEVLVLEVVLDLEGEVVKVCGVGGIGRCVGRDELREC